MIWDCCRLIAAYILAPEDGGGGCIADSNADTGGVGAPSPQPIDTVMVVRAAKLAATLAAACVSNRRRSVSAVAGSGVGAPQSASEAAATGSASARQPTPGHGCAAPADATDPSDQAMEMLESLRDVIFNEYVDDGCVVAAAEAEAHVARLIADAAAEPRAELRPNPRSAAPEGACRTESARPKLKADLVAAIAGAGGRRRTGSNALLYANYVQTLAKQRALAQVTLEVRAECLREYGTRRAALCPVRRRIRELVSHARVIPRDWMARPRGWGRATTHDEYGLLVRGAAQSFYGRDLVSSESPFCHGYTRVYGNPHCKYRRYDLYSMASLAGRMLQTLRKPVTDKAAPVQTRHPAPWGGDECTELSQLVSKRLKVQRAAGAEERAEKRALKRRRAELEEGELMTDEYESELEEGELADD